MAQGRGNAFLVAVFFASLQVASAASKGVIVYGCTYTVAGSYGWQFPPGTDTTYYNTWSAKQSFYSGDVLVFKYTAGTHDVQVAKTAAGYTGCAATGKTYSNGMDSIALDTAGTFFYICAHPLHCDQGMKMKVVVSASATVTSGTRTWIWRPAPSPDPTPRVPATSPPTPRAPATSPPTPAPATSPPAAPPESMPPMSSTNISICPGISMSCNMKKDAPKSSIILPIVIVAIVVLIIASALIATCILVVRRRRGYEKVDALTQSGQHRGGGKLNIVVDSYPRTFTYKELSKATKSFSAKELLGRGGFGSVYRGVLPNTGGTVVAVKQIAQESRQGEREFLAEVTIISKIRHRNLVRLLGWCNEKSNLLLVCDYMSNGSLDKALHEHDTSDNNIDINIKKTLSWTCRYNIVTGVAAALSYLHGDWEHCVLHRDIKPSNVLLDSDMNARLAYFGLARLVGHNKDALTTMMEGTFGYMAPELPHTGKVTMQSDVYSFGILALEVVSGQKPLHIEEHSEVQIFILLDTVWAAHEQKNLSSTVDRRLGDNYDLKEATLILEVALLCCHPDPVARPSMKTVSQVLSGIIELPILPTSRPMVTYSLRPKESVLDTVMSHSKHDIDNFGTFGSPKLREFNGKRMLLGGWERIGNALGRSWENMGTWHWELGNNMLGDWEHGTGNLLT